MDKVRKVKILHQHLLSWCHACSRRWLAKTPHSTPLYAQYPKLVSWNYRYIFTYSIILVVFIYLHG